ncbi:2-phosphoxylose phosphatase 1 [Blomia tropicalis]|nr:2-phosphoxylose phosphatase 1 [Blomia tropicalis]
MEYGRIFWFFAVLFIPFISIVTYLIWHEFDNKDHVLTLWKDSTNYCNPVEHIRLKDETYVDQLVQSGYELSKVIVILRHGDRGPLRQLKRLNSLYCDDQNVKDLLNRFRELFQHYQIGSSLPSEYFKLPDKKCRRKRLTRVGLSQQVKLGQMIGQLYWDKLGLYTENLNRFVNVTTTNYSRTFQSALAFLFGMLGSDIAAFNSTILKVIKDPYFCGIDGFQQYCMGSCTQISKITTQLDWRLLLTQQELKEIQILIKKVGQIIATDLTQAEQFNSLMSIFDGVSAYQCHDEALPCDPVFGCVTLEQVRNVTELLCLQGTRLYQSSSYQQICWLKIYPFLHYLFLQSNVFNSETKFHIFAAHDITLESLKTVLRLDDCSIPPYSSRFIFEIYKKQMKNYIRLIYNGQDVTSFLTVKFKSILDFKLIPFEQFEFFLRQKFKSVTGYNDYRDACDHESKHRDLDNNDLDRL